MKPGSREPGSARHVLNVSVLFPDGSAEGFPNAIDFMVGRRLGRTDEAFRVAEVLNGHRLSTAADIDNALGRLGPLPRSPEEAFTSAANAHPPEVNIEAIQSHGSSMANGFYAGVRTVREAAAGTLRADEQLLLSGNQRDRARAEDDLTQETAYYRWLSTVTRARVATHDEAAAQ